MAPLRDRLKKAKEESLLDERIPHPYREIVKELRAIRSLLERPAAAALPPTIRIPGVTPAPAPTAYIDVVAHGLQKYGALILAKDLYVDTIKFDTARATPEEFPKFTGVALTIFRNDGTFVLYMNEKDDYHKLTIDALTYPQTLLIDWFNLKTIYITNTAQAGKSATLIAWKPVEAPPAIAPPKPILMITPGDRETFRRMGDVNRDGIIDDRDLELLKMAYGSKPDAPNWNIDADLNGDGVVDGKDIATASRNFGLTIEVWKAGR